MQRSTPKILIVNTYYPAFLTQFYAENPGLETRDYDEQHSRLFAFGFSVSDAYSNGLKACGWDAHEVVVNADYLQNRWAAENGLGISAVDIRERRKRIVAAQIGTLRPDVLLVFEWCPLGDAFWAEMKGGVRLLVGQIASGLPANRTFAAYDLMLSSFPPLVDYFREQGLRAEPLRLAFDQRVLDRINAQPAKYDVSFVGGFDPNAHPHRIAWLERLLRALPIAIFGYGLEHVPPGSPIHRHYRGPAWGYRMYEVLQQSRITLNLHARIDIRGRVDLRFANNMRLYEATGVGACLVTDWKENLPELFKPGKEVITFMDEDDCIDGLRHYLDHELERRTTARDGQQRTLGDHTYQGRMVELRDLLITNLQKSIPIGA